MPENRVALREPMPTPAAFGTQVVHELFAAVVAEHGRRVAVSFQGRDLTYSELDVKANAVAGKLAALGVKQGDLVAVMLPHSIEIVVAFLAVLKCGAAYLPLDPANPPARNLEFMRAARVGVIIGDAGPDAVYARGRAALGTEDFHTGRGGAPEVRCGGDDRAYVMYTSGSTGVPKGVVVPHRGITRLVCDTNYIAIQPQDRMLQLAPTSFDASTFEIWGALLNGATLVPYSGRSLDPNRLRQDVHDNGITILWLTAGLFSLVADQAVDALRPLRILLAGGDVLNARYVNKVIDQVPGITVINGYGPTENTTFTCCHPMTSANKPEGTVPIGRPISGTRVHVLDEQRRPVPRGSVGELYASGRGVALGYLDQQQGEAFFTDDTLAPGLIYRTGDLVHERPDGALEFVGRRDSLVKVRGYRVSLEEVRTHIVSLDDVVDAAVVKKDLPSGDQILVAYVRKIEGSDMDAKSLRRRLVEQIPAYMVPSKVVFDDALAINDNGKIDRNRILRHLHQGSNEIGRQ